MKISENFSTLSKGIASKRVDVIVLAHVKVDRFGRSSEGSYVSCGRNLITGGYPVGAVSDLSINLINQVGADCRFGGVFRLKSAKKRETKNSSNTANSIFENQILTA